MKFSLEDEISRKMDKVRRGWFLREGKRGGMGETVGSHKKRKGAENNGRF